MRHSSDCATHNEPAFRNEPCNCDGVGGLKEKVAALNRARPELPAKAIAAELDCTAGYVRATAKRDGLTLGRMRDWYPKSDRLP